MRKKSVLLNKTEKVTKTIGVYEKNYPVEHQKVKEADRNHILP